MLAARRGVQIVLCLLCAALVVVGVSLAPAAPARAATFVGFEVDGDEMDNPLVAGADWQSISPSVIHDSVGSSDASQISGSESGGPSTWIVGSPGSASGKTDIGNVYIAGAVDQLSHEWTYLAWDRAANSGTAAFYVELNALPTVTSGGLPRPVRSVGDLRIKLETSGSSTILCDAVQTWTGSAWGAAATCGPSFAFAVNQVPITDYFGSANAVGGDIPANQFLEIGIDLTAIGASNCAGVVGYQSLSMRSASSTSESSQLSDFASGNVSVPSRCASLKLVKVGADGAPVPGVQFTVTPNPATGTGSTTVTTGADGTYTFGKVEPGTAPATGQPVPSSWLTYTVAETAVPTSSGYLKVSDDPSNPGTWQTQGASGFGEVRTKAPQADAMQTVSVQPMGQYTMGVIDPVAWKPLTPTLAVTASYDQTRSWTIQKTPAAAEYDAAHGQTSVQTSFTVTTTEGPVVVSAQRASAQVTVQNPNARAETGTLQVTLDGAACTITATDADTATPGLQLVFQPGSNGPYSATCTDSGTPGGTASATVSWSRAAYPGVQSDYDAPASAGTGSTTTGQQSFTSTLTGTTPSSVDVYDQLASPAGAAQKLGTVTAAGAGTTRSFPVTASVPVTIGVCSPVVNDAYLSVAGTKTASAEATTTACGPVPWVLIQKRAWSASGSGAPLDGSQWVVLADTSGTPGAVLTSYPVTPVTGSTGQFRIAGIPVGTYWLEETVAPHGYSLLAQPIRFTVSAGGAVTLGAGTASGITTTAPTSPATDWRINVGDVPALSLPLAGGTGTAPLMLAGAALLLAAAAVAVAVLLRRRRA